MLEYNQSCVQFKFDTYIFRRSDLPLNFNAGVRYILRHTSCLTEKVNRRLYSQICKKPSHVLSASKAAATRLIRDVERSWDRVRFSCVVVQRLIYRNRARQMNFRGYQTEFGSVEDNGAAFFPNVKPRVNVSGREISRENQGGGNYGTSRALGQARSRRAARPCIFNLRTFRQPCRARGINTYNHPRRRVLLLEVETAATPLALTYICAPLLARANVETCHRVKYRKRPEKTSTRCRCAVQSRL